MALTKSLELVSNFNEPVTFPNAYIKVELVWSNKETCTAAYKIYKEQDGFALQEHSTIFDLDLDGPNPIKQAYCHLKTLPQFVDAVDC